jgi:hypothetical protein
MVDVWPVLVKRWYGFGNNDWHWSLFCICETQERAEESVNNLMKPSNPRARYRVGNEFSRNRKPEAKYQRNMVL